MFGNFAVRRQKKMAWTWVEIGKEEAEQKGRPFIKLKNEGDTIIGKYLGIETVPNNIPGKSGTKEVFRLLTKDTRDSTGKATLEMLLDPNHDLGRRMRAATVGDLLRITRTGTLDTGQINPMVTYKVEREVEVAAPTPSDVPF